MLIQQSSNLSCLKQKGMFNSYNASVWINSISGLHCILPNVRINVLTSEYDLIWK